ncbi:MAG: D-2-hydroxyacid dehydrogenase [Xanthobacteraceae bacterium]
MKIVLFESRNRFGALEDELGALGASLVRARAPEALGKALAGAEVLVTTNRLYTPEHAAVIRAHGKNLKWIQFITSGIDNAVASGLPSGVAVTNSAGLRAFAVAEHAIALMLGLVRRLRATEKARGEQFWARDAIAPTMENLSGKHLVLVGLGAIGQEIARKAKVFDMQVTGISRASGPIAHVDRIRPRGELRAAAEEADFLLLSVIYDESTDKILSRAVIDAMKPAAYVVNIARGQLVDEAALIEALKAKKIAGAGIDVTVSEPLPAGHPFWAMPNVLLTPHLGGAGNSDEGAAFTKILLDNLRRWVAKEPLKNVVIERTP